MNILLILVFLNTQFTYTLKKGDNLANVFTKAGLSQETNLKLINILKKEINIRRCFPGEKIIISTDSSKNFVKLVYEKKDATYVVDSLFCIQRLKECIVLAHLKGVVDKGILYDAVIKKGGTPKLVYEFADEVFPWDIDFNVETRKNDTFEILVPQKYVDERFIGYGKIIYAAYRGWIGNYTGIYYIPEGKRPRYYDKKGKSLQKLFLKAPLSYRRVSSKFSRSRLHPILRIRRPHYGVDYAAPMGTAVRAIGDGKVTFKGWNGDYGRQVIIRHGKGYKTYYGHLSRYAKGIRKNKWVKQGQIIGYVGSSGLSTGPHLDFKIKRYKRWIDPLKLKPPSLKPLSKKELTRYKKYQNELSILFLGIETMEEIKTLTELGKNIKYQVSNIKDTN